MAKYKKSIAATKLKIQTIGKWDTKLATIKTTDRFEQIFENTFNLALVNRIIVLRYQMPVYHRES